MKKNEFIDLTINDVTIEGVGIGKFENFAVFVPSSAIGDQLKVKIIKVNKKYAVGKIESIILSSRDRINIDCVHYPKCGGCVFRHISYDAELKIKRKHVLDCIQRIGGFKNQEIESIIPCEKINFYRNKSQVPVREENGIIAGFFSLHSHRVVDCPKCLIHPEIFNEIVEAVKSWVLKYKVSIYSEEKHTGFLSHIYLRHSEKTKEIMLCLVANGDNLPFKNEFTKYILGLFPNISSIILNVNKEKTNVILGQKSILVWGKDYITDVLCGIKFNISPMSFYQVNSFQTEILYSIVADLIGNDKNSSVLDLYCGIGTIGLSVSSRVSEVIGVEVVPQAVENAIENARQNEIKNAKFICCDASNIEENIGKFKKIPNIFILDPPRKGCSQSLIDFIIKSKPKKLIYVSCNPATLARDLKILCENDFKIGKIIPVDMFPRTAHVETVCLLESAKNLPHISFTVNMEELPRPTRKSATYDEIKAYVSEKHGLKVSSLYIAQIKEKHGLKERENYNIGNGKSKELICPPEKEQAILDAFKHFGMIK